MPKSTSGSAPELRLRYADAVKLDWNETIGGFPMLQVRDLMKRLFNPTHPAAIAELLGHVGEPAELTTQLLARGWIETDEDGLVSTTVLGNAVGQAKKLSPLTRQQATKLLEEVIAAAEGINADPRYAHGVQRLAVFGSYLSDTEALNDLDIAFELSTRWQDRAESMAVAHARSDAAWPPPPSADWMARLLWPERVVIRRLRVSRRVSLARLSDMLSLNCPFEKLIG